MRAIWIVLSWLYISALTAQPYNWTVYTEENSGIPNDRLHSLAIDRNGLLWAGAGHENEDAALMSFDGKTWTAYGENNSGLEDFLITSIAIDDSNNVWAGTANKGIAVFRQEYDKSWQVYNKHNTIMDDDNINVVTFDPSGMAWIGTHTEGLYHLENNKWQAFKMDNSEIPDDHIRNIVFDRIGNAWIATRYGLARYDGEDWDVFHRSNSDISSNHVDCLAIDEHNNLWVAGRMLSKFDQVRFEEVKKLKHVHCMAVDYKGVLWVGTYSHGLYTYDGTQWIRYMPDDSPLPHFEVHAILVDADNTKWVATDHGLAKIEDPLIAAEVLPLDQLTGLSMAFDPESNQLLLDFEEYEGDMPRVRILDQIGNTRIQFSGFADRVLEISTHHLAPGTYELHIDTAEATYMQEIQIGKMAAGG